MSKSNPLEYDDLLFNVLKECKTLPIFLDRIFGFLQRRTDFYYETNDPNSPVGLPKGLAEKLVKHAFLKWKPPNEDERSVLRENEIPPVVVEEVVVSEEVRENKSDNIVDYTDTDEKPPIRPESPEPGPSSGIRAVEEIVSFTKSEMYNGAAYANYCWSQTILDVDIVIRIPDKITSKDLKVIILPRSISVKIRNDVVLEDELCQKCKHNDAIWSLDKNRLQIHLDKCQETWWDCLVTSEKRLDLSKIDCTRPFEDLSEEAQAKIAELGWNQERRRLGLKTSDQSSREALLKRAWNAEGSPFSGPFDPSKVEFH